LGFADHGYEVLHLRPKKEPLTHRELEEQLLDRYFSDRGQIVIGELMKDEKTLLKEAYQLRNAEIGYYYVQKDGI